MSEMRDGDIYHWVWNEARVERSRKFWGNTNLYHCKSQIAVVVDGVLKDTFWGTSGSDGYLSPNDVVLTFQGNVNDMSVILEWEKVFYRREDLVDMNHSNNSRAPVYAKPGTSRDAATMKEYYETKIADAERDIVWEHRRIKECQDSLARIEAGELTGIFSTYSK